MNKKLTAAILTAAMASSMLAGCGSAAKAPEGATISATYLDEHPELSDTAATEAGDTEDWTSAYPFQPSKSHPAAPDWTEYSDLIRDIYKETDLNHREAKLHKAEDLLMATGAVIPLYYYNDVYLKKEGIEGDFSNLFGTKYFMYTTKDGKPMDKFSINMASEPDRLDPQLNTSVDGAALAANSFAGLYTYDPEDPSKVIPALADGDPEMSADGVNYTIHMKDGLKWSDGSVLNANDFVYSWNRAADPATAADYSYLFDIFARKDDGTLELAAPDENTITFKLAAPCPYLMNLLAFPVFMPVPEAAVKTADPDGSNPGLWAQDAGFISNGAYTLKSWNHSESMIYVKNPNYYDADNVTVNELDFMLSADDTSALAAYNSGDIQFADSIPSGEVKNWKEKPDFNVIDNLGTYFVGFNVNSKMFEGKTPDQANAMRRALSLLVDRQYIVDTIGMTGQVPALTFIPGNQSDGHGGKFRTNDADYTYPDKEDAGYYGLDVAANTEEAKALLEKAGYKFGDDGMLSDDTPLSIEYLVNEGSGNESIAQALQQDWGMIGIKVNISVEDWQTFMNDRKVGNFDVAREGWVCDYDDPINMLEMYLPESGNNDCQLGKD